MKEARFLSLQVYELYLRKESLDGGQKGDSGKRYCVGRELGPVSGKYEPMAEGMFQRVELNNINAVHF